MKVILLHNVPGVGKIDEVKDVSEGYARNFLFPRHLAVQASPKALADQKAHQARLKKESEKELQREQALADRLTGYALHLKGKANDKGALYAAVTGVAVAEEMAKKDIPVTKDQIRLKPIKTLGTHTARVVLGHGLEVDIAIVVSKL